MARFYVAAAFASFALIHTSWATETHDRPTVSIHNGTVSGLYSPGYQQDFFLGVPFAQPPVGALRFRVPQSINSSFDGTYEATGYAPECYGYGTDQIGYSQSEDCLYLNVIRPTGYENQTLPVGVWFYGGGLYQGGTADKRFNLTFIVENSVKIGKPITAVALAYRLGPWGFIASQEVVDAGDTNIGLRDQRLGLHWINENIAAFGGDPQKVTLFGVSAGAASIGWQLTAYNGRDDHLFRAAIMQSGNPVAYSTYKTASDYQSTYAALVNGTGCGDAVDTLVCLRLAPIDTIQSVVNSTTTLSRSWQPIVDGDFIARWASIQLIEGAFVKVPIISGANTDEGTEFAPNPVNSPQDFSDSLTDSSLYIYLPTTTESEELVSKALELYPDDPAYRIPSDEELSAENYTFPASYGAQYRRSASYAGDLVMIANRRGACEAWTAHGVPVYSYRFNTLPAGISPARGITHFTETAFVLDNTLGLGYDAAHNSSNPFADMPQSYFDLAKLMSCSWASFIHDLDPNTFEGRYEDADAWPLYNLTAPENVVWDATLDSLAHVEADTWRAESIRWILDHASEYHR